LSGPDPVLTVLNPAASTSRDRRAREVTASGNDRDCGHDIQRCREPKRHRIATTFVMQQAI
jgi:hypothetical protein